MNDKDIHISDEVLNALADREYPMHRQAELMARVQADDALAHKACGLRSLKAMVQNAYEEVPAARAERRRQRTRYGGIAASLVFAFATVLALWTTHDVQRADRFVVLDADGRGERPAVAGDEETRIVFHLLDADMDVAGELLDEVETVLADFRDRHAPLRIEVVAHSDGLALLRKRLSTHQQQIARLAEEYPNLTFVACHNTVRRLRVEKGVEVTLLPQARETASGVTHVVKRQQEGWAYIKV